MATGAVAALVCIGVSVLCLVLVGLQETNRAQARATAGWDRVLPIMKLGHLPAVLPDRRDGKEQAIQVLDARGQVVSATRQLVGKPPIATLRTSDGGVRTERTLCSPAGLKGCMTVVMFKVYSQPGGIWLLNVAVPVVPWYGSCTALLLAIGASVLITAMVAAGTFCGLTKDLAPVDAIRTELAEITSTGLHRHVPMPRNSDELALLAETANAAMDRLEGTYQQVRQFTSDASHDLRNPITAMRTQVEEALMSPDDTDWPRTAKTVLVDLDRLQAIVTDLLTLAQLDAGAPLTREPTDLAHLVSAELDHRTCSRIKIVKNLDPGVVIDCDRLRITRLLANLLDNAERHATSQITITVRADTVRADTMRADTMRADTMRADTMRADTMRADTMRAGTVRAGTVRTDCRVAKLEVIDDGAGIAAEHREKVFERFTRLHASRCRDAGGTGLGLPIARQIAQAHQGTLTIQDSPRGARFVLRLPMCDPPPDH